MSIQLLFGDHAEDAKPSALCSFCELPCMANQGHGGLGGGVSGEPRFKPRTFFFPHSPLHQCAALFAFAEICKWNYFTYVQISRIYSLFTWINISCARTTSGIDSSLICDTHVQTVFPCVVVDLHIDPLFTKSFLPSSTNPFSVLKPEIISRVSWIVQCSWCQEPSGSDWLGTG